MGLKVCHYPPILRRQFKHTDDFERKFCYNGYMKRDMTLIKLILEHVDSSRPDRRGFLDHPEFPGYDDELIEYHVRLCTDAGFVRTNNTGHIIEMTWHGHDALDKLRRDSP